MHVVHILAPYLYARFDVRIDSRAPFIFNYVNDMSGTVNHKLLLYANDSAILAAVKNILTIEIWLQNELEVVSEWLVDNKLSFHLGKIESILFGFRSRLKHNQFCGSRAKDYILSLRKL